MTPKVKSFKNVFPDSSTGHRTTFCDQIRRKSAVAMLPKGAMDYNTKKTRARRDSSQPPFCPKMGLSHPKFPERCHPLTRPRILNLVRIGCALPDLFQKDWFIGPKSTTSNNMKLVGLHWPLMGGLLYLVQRGRVWAGSRPAQTSHRCTKCNSPAINGQCIYQSPYSCIMVRCSAVLTCPLKG